MQAPAQGCPAAPRAPPPCRCQHACGPAGKHICTSTRISEDATMKLCWESNALFAAAAKPSCKCAQLFSPALGLLSAPQNSPFAPLTWSAPSPWACCQHHEEQLHMCGPLPTALCSPLCAALPPHLGPVVGHKGQGHGQGRHGCRPVGGVQGCQHLAQALQRALGNGGLRGKGQGKEVA